MKNAKESVQVVCLEKTQNSVIKSIKHMPKQFGPRSFLSKKKDIRSKIKNCRSKSNLKSNIREKSAQQKKTFFKM